MFIDHKKAGALKFQSINSELIMSTASETVMWIRSVLLDTADEAVDQVSWRDRAELITKAEHMRYFTYAKVSVCSASE